nr:hypothetical protein [Tanacetum cinerariifolium]
MSSDNAQSTVTYTSISSNSDGPSWGIPLMNADPMELDEHAPVYVPEPQHPEYHAPSDDNIQVENDDDDPMEDPEEDPSEEHEPEDDDEDPEVDPNEEHKSKGSDETEPFKEDKIAVTPPPSRHRGARISVRPQTPMAASTQALTDAFAFGSSPFPLPPISPAYDHAQLGRRAAMIHRKDDILEEDMPPWRRFAFTGSPPGCDVAESSATAAARAPRSQYDFVDIVEAGHGLICSPGHDTQTIARAADRAKDASYVRALQASERRMMTSIKEVNLRVSCQAQVRRQESENFYTQFLDAQTDHRDIRLEIDVVKGQRTAYETELQEVHQAYLSSEARNRELLARLETLETHMSRMEWQRQSVEDLAVTQMMRIHTLEARARADMVEDADSNLEIELWNLRVKENDVAPYTQRFQELALMCTKFLADETEKLTTRAYTAGPGEKKVYTGDLPLCTKCNYHHTRQCAPKCGKCKRYVHTTMNCRVNTNNNNNNNNNNNKNQKAGACYECGNTGHIKKNCPKLKNHRNGSVNGVAQGRVYALGGRDASPDSNVITSKFLLNNSYAKILFDTGADRSFVSTTFSALIDIISTTLENHYDVEL